MALPTGMAQDGAALALDDPAGDVKTELAGQPASGGEAAYPGVDLVGLTIREEAFSLVFTVRAAALQKAADPGADGVLYQTFFVHNGREFRLVQQMAFRGLNDNAFTSLAYRDAPDSDWSITWTGGSAIDEAAGTLSADVGRDLLADRSGAAPYPGRKVEGVHVLAQSVLTDGALVFVEGEGLLPVPHRVTDSLPDTAPYPSFSLQLGIAQTGHARLGSEAPFRASNGEATTFVYEVVAHNLGAEEDTFEFGASGVPAGYTLTLPVPVLALPAGGNDTVPVLLAMPFGHQHGQLAAFVLELRSVRDPSAVGRLAMGIRFLEVPQPAGHHDTVYLHTSGGPEPLGALFGPLGYMNTLEDDPNDAGQRMCDRSLGLGSVANPGTWHVSWPFYLSPGLALGLDVDPGKVGHLRVPIATTMPALQAQLFANVYLEPPDGEDGVPAELVHIAGMPGTALADLPGGGATTLFEGDLLPAEAAPRLPYQEGANLVLWLTLQFKGPNSFGAADEGACVLPGGSAVLPLREWHDAVDEALAAVDGPTLRPLGPQERRVNPGEAAAFLVAVGNPLHETSRIDLELSGPNAGWAILGDRSLAVPAKGTHEARILVRAPPGAADGERADLVLQAYPRDDPSARGLLRLVAVVDGSMDHADDSAGPGSAGKDAPALPLGAAAAALVLMALARRQRHP